MMKVTETFCGCGHPPIVIIVTDLSSLFRPEGCLQCFAVGSFDPFQAQFNEGRCSQYASVVSGDMVQSRKPVPTNVGNYMY